MRIVIIAVAAIVLLGGGAAGAYFYFSQKADASVGPDGEPVEVADKEKDSHDKDDKHGGGYGEFVELGPLILPIVDGNGVSQTVSMVISLEVPDIGVADDVKRLKPKLTDAYIQDMYGVLSRHAALKGGVLQIGQLKKRLTKVTDKVMGTDVVQDVLLQVVQQRPI